MEVKTVGQPVAGEAFSFEVTFAVGAAHLTWYLDGLVFFESDCPDPPCHDMLLIPRDAGGKVLRLVGEDLSGGKEMSLIVLERQYPVSRQIEAGA